MISERRKQSPDARVVAWTDAADVSDLFISVLALGEIRSGIERLKRSGDAPQSDSFERWLGQLKADFAQRIIGVTVEIAERWGTLNAIRPLPVIDGLLAATAIEHGLTFVTRDAAAVEGTGVAVLDPWAAP